MLGKSVKTLHSLWDWSIPEFTCWQLTIRSPKRQLKSGNLILIKMKSNKTVTLYLKSKKRTEGLLKGYIKWLNLVDEKSIYRLTRLCITFQCYVNIAMLTYLNMMFKCN